MFSYDQIREYLIQHFFTEINESTPASYTEEVARSYLRRFLSSEFVDAFWFNNGDIFITELLEEFTRRRNDGVSVFFVFLDEYGKKLKGQLEPYCDIKYSLFQKALMLLTDIEFQHLSARILDFVGCKLTFLTPLSHDQGLDGFGFKPLLSYEVTASFKNSLDVWILIQAKHYEKHAISSKEIRELVGSSNLAIHKIYATESERYPLLDLKPFAPIALIVTTSGEVKRTVSTLAKKSGIILITGCELCSIFYNHSTALRSLASPSAETIAEILRQEAQLAH